MKAGVSTVILTFNEEANLPALLRSLNGLECPVFVVDSFSTDRTCAIAAEAGATVVQHEFQNYGAQRNWAQANLPIATEYVLHLDADERLTPALVDEINAVVRADRKDVNGYLLRKRTVFMGRWIRHGGHYPSYHMRLFKKAAGRCEDRLYDQHYVVTGRAEKLANDYIDVITSDISAWSRRHVRWAELEAAEVTTASPGEGRVQPRALGTETERKRWLRQQLYARMPLFVRPFGYWFYRYVLRLGFLDGVEGLIFHFLQGLWYRFLIDVKIYELRTGRR
jgi:glycosyltransferase involved in cell wall biosynthesis